MDCVVRVVLTLAYELLFIASDVYRAARCAVTEALDLALDMYLTTGN